ncbi:cyclic nucleotide-binding domain-containing protein [Enterovirga rhinocerotis]|uniref:Cyclic nucleotide-binding protein n=1 Tax=Enterovirga rhinocerotis TaxID=1339210 RepID=A0A4R7BSR2_9HYPH|nr:cyclic nucleotide-binding domain-containing protein [Enterovirga rhinocerotis]TDR87127.1 cyclic nucleotide-binding protein [Enterovirga rhinocerotis]
MPLDDLIDLLAKVPVFDLLGRDALRLMAFAAETRRLRTGEYLFRQGERSDGGYVVLSGELETRREDAESGRIQPKGALIGRTALFLRTKRPVSAIARERSEVLRISLTLMRRTLEEYPDAALAIREALAEDLDALAGDLDRARQLLDAVTPSERRSGG